MARAPKTVKIKFVDDKPKRWADGVHRPQFDVKVGDVVEVLEETADAAIKAGKAELYDGPAPTANDPTKKKR